MTPANDKSYQPGDAAWRFIEPFRDAVSIYGGPEVFLLGFGQLPQPIGHLFAVLWCDAEVCNGGLYQFFSNPTGILAPEAADGFRAVGLHECAALLNLAIREFGESYPRDPAARDDRLHALERPGEERREWDPFYELDDRYYAAREQSGFYERVDEFAMPNAR